MKIYKVRRLITHEGQPYLSHVVSVLFLTCAALLRGKFSWKEVLRKLYEFGAGSLGVILLCVTFIGIIIVLEYSYHMKLVIGNDSLIPAFSMIMLTRELAPAVSALLLVSKFGASVAAELGAMKTTGQLDAYRLLGINPIYVFVAPRVIASSLATLMLSMISLFTAVAGGVLAAVYLLNFTVSSYFQSLFLFVKAEDLILCMVKALLFGASIPIISATLGFRCKFGAEGVGLTTTDAVVANTIWIIILDFLLTYAFLLMTA